MSLIQTIKADQVQARKARSASASILTTLIGEAEMIGKNAGDRESTDEEVIAIIKKFIKNLDETIVALATGEMTDAKAKNIMLARDERAIIEPYLPKQLSETELRAAIRDLVTTNGASGLGSLMKVLKERFEGTYDGKMASMIAKEELSK